MDEVDELILRDLRDAKCNIPEGVKRLKELDREVFINCILRCLKIIDKERDYPRQLSKNTAQRVNQATMLVNLMLENGYDQSNISYHNLLYPNESDTRKILMWLQEKLPKGDERPDDEFAKGLEKEISFLIDAEKNIWAPHFCNQAQDRGLNYYTTINAATVDIYCPSTALYYRNNQRKTAEMDRYFNQFQPWITQQPKKRSDVAPSVFEYNLATITDAAEREAEWNSTGLGSGLNPIEFKKKKKADILARMGTHLRSALNEANSDRAANTFNDFLKNGSNKPTTKLERAIEFRKESNVAPQETEEEIEKRRKLELEEKRNELENVEREISEIEKRIQGYQNEMRQLQSSIPTDQSKNEDLQKQFDQLNATLGLLPNAQENIKKLKDRNRENANTLTSLAKQWEEHRKPLVQQYYELKSKLSTRKEQADVKLEKIKEMRARMKELVEEVTKKDERYKQLVEVFKQLPKDNRANYTMRILEMVKNVKKQKVEINKVLLDTRSLQKEINSLSETLNRTFSVVEEMVFKDAPTDPVASSTYKILANLHSNFGDLNTMTSELGNIKNSELTLEENINKGGTTVTNLNIERIQEDLKQVRAENSKLIQQYKDLTK
jgi:uncharacterized coiled-coil DUF342 family protein